MQSFKSYVLLLTGILLAFFMAFSSQIAGHFTFDRLSPAAAVSAEAFLPYVISYIRLLVLFNLTGLYYLIAMIVLVRKVHFTNASLRGCLGSGYIALLILPVINLVIGYHSFLPLTLLVAIALIGTIAWSVSFIRNKGLDTAYISRHAFVMLLSALFIVAVLSLAFYGYSGRYTYLVLLTIASLIFSGSLLHCLRFADCLTAKVWGRIFIFLTILGVIFISLIIGFLIINPYMRLFMMSTFDEDLTLNIVVPILCAPVGFLINRYI